MEYANVFATLNAINVNEHTEKKNGLTYLSWAWAWGVLKSNFPNSTFKVYEDVNGLNYFTDGRTCYVKCSVTVEGCEMIETLPVMDYKNASIPVDRVTSFDVNKAIKRCITKAISLHGLGLYIYAGEDLPEEESTAAQKPQPKVTVKKKAEPAKVTPANVEARINKVEEMSLYEKLIKMEAEGIKTKSGLSGLEKFKQTYNCTAEMISKFNEDVENYRRA